MSAMLDYTARIINELHGPTPPEADASFGFSASQRKTKNYKLSALCAFAVNYEISVFSAGLSDQRARARDKSAISAPLR